MVNVRRNKRARTALSQSTLMVTLAIWQPSKEGTLAQLPDELLLNIMSFLDGDTLLVVAKLCRSLGRTAQEQLFHSITLDTRHLKGIFHRARQLTRTLLCRPDLQSKVKNLSMYIAQTGRSTTNDPDPLSQDQKTIMVDMMVDAHWGMIGGRSGPAAEAYRNRCGGTLGAVLILLPTLKSLNIKTQSVKTSIALYTLIFGEFRAPFHSIPAFSKLRTLTIQQPPSCPPPPWLHFAAPDSLLDLGNLTRLELSILSPRTLEPFAASVFTPPSKMFAIKHLSLELYNFSGFPTTNVRLAHFLACIGPLTSFTYKDATLWWERGDSPQDNLAYCALPSHLTASHESLEKLTIVWRNYDYTEKPLNAYPITTLRDFKQLRVLDIEQGALVGRPIERINRAWDHLAGQEVEVGGGLLEKLPLSLETLVVQGADLNVIGLCDELLLQKSMAAELRDEEGYDGEGRACAQAADGEYGGGLYENEGLYKENSEYDIDKASKREGEGLNASGTCHAKEPEENQNMFPLASLRNVTVRLNKTRQVVPATLLDRWDKAGWKLDGEFVMEDRSTWPWKFLVERVEV
ncbi:uncharacterized protein BDZ99DRAFT_483176 [Mytilinidion resinicola]|uniref:F-box domain-containing protein n=1 Tax=Mytilinidion resinicola TaxID=574789 RepID=A0A6A6Y022_9PEZI|nr:uncharacterized protein BDZ99DRAFT_483176 [Mytilinidion resinicola]KAF2802166.1 hypothetical protein BDZ99DRAFT_483176 [Mytilinidion resinicola]